MPCTSVRHTEAVGPARRASCMAGCASQDTPTLQTNQGDSDDTMDALFDIQYFECDPLTRLDKDTPLHVAVRYANDKDPELGFEMISMMCEAGCDPRVRNKHGQKPAELVYNNQKIKSTLQQAEYILAEGLRDDADNGSAHDSASDSE